MAKYIRKAMSISTIKIKQCKLAPTVTVLCTHNFACTNVHTKPFYVHENECMQILNLSSPVNVPLYRDYQFDGSKSEIILNSCIFLIYCKFWCIMRKKIFLFILAVSKILYPSQFKVIRWLIYYSDLKV